MRKQLTLGTGFEKYAKTTRRENFLDAMDRIVPGSGRRDYLQAHGIDVGEGTTACRAR